MSILSYEEVEARVQKDACPDLRQIIQRAVDRYRKHEPGLLYVTTLQELITQLTGVVAYFYLRQVHAATEQEQDKWLSEAHYLSSYIRQLKALNA